MAFDPGNLDELHRLRYELQHGRPAPITQALRQLAVGAGAPLRAKLIELAVAADERLPAGPRDRALALVDHAIAQHERVPLFERVTHTAFRFDGQLFVSAARGARLLFETLHHGRRQVHSRGKRPADADRAAVRELFKDKTLPPALHALAKQVGIETDAADVPWLVAPADAHVRTIDQLGTPKGFGVRNLGSV
jgi:hypothetical protein